MCTTRLIGVFLVAFTGVVGLDVAHLQDRWVVLLAQGTLAGLAAVGAALTDSRLFKTPAKPRRRSND